MSGYNQPEIPKMYNVNTNHPIIPNPQEVLYQRKYVSIHSEDRDMVKFPNSSEFDIEMPEDMVNVLTMRLSNHVRAVLALGRLIIQFWLSVNSSMLTVVALPVHSRHK